MASASTPNRMNTILACVAGLRGGNGTPTLLRKILRPNHDLVRIALRRVNRLRALALLLSHGTSYLLNSTQGRFVEERVLYPNKQTYLVWSPERVQGTRRVIAHARVRVWLFLSRRYEQPFSLEPLLVLLSFLWGHAREEGGREHRLL
jgi:hypothetical protein